MPRRIRAAATQGGKMHTESRKPPPVHSVPCNQKRLRRRSIGTNSVADRALARGRAPKVALMSEAVPAPVRWACQTTRKGSAIGAAVASAKTRIPLFQGRKWDRIPPFTRLSETLLVDIVPCASHSVGSVVDADTSGSKGSIPLSA